MRAIFLVLALLVTTPVSAGWFHKPKVEEQVITPPGQVVQIRPMRDPVKPKGFWDGTGQAIARGGVIALGVNAVLWTARIGLAVIGAPFL
jgi:hypothetical protein